MRPSLVILMLALAGCATARVVTVYPRRGGVIAIQPTGSAEARQKAEALMRENCSRGYEITQEGEAVVGSSTQTRYSEQTSPKGKGGINLWRNLSGEQTSTTEQDVEWRLTYKCSGGASS